MAQIVQLLGTIIHKPRLIVLDEPFAGLDAINQGRLEELIRREARAGVTIIFSTHVIAHAERLCELIAIIAKGKIAFDGRVDEARARLRPIVRLGTRAKDGAWRSAIPASARREGLRTASQARERLAFALGEVEALRAAEDPLAEISHHARRLFDGHDHGVPGHYGLLTLVGDEGRADIRVGRVHHFQL